MNSNAMSAIMQNPKLKCFILPVRRRLCGYAVEQFSDDEYECDFESHKASSSVANIDEWKWKLSMLLRNENDQEIVSRDKRDRRDYEQISNLAKRMGLYSEMYGKVVVASKVPLPNYRPDLDDKRPQREVVVPLGLQRRVECLLQEYLDRLQLNSGKFRENSDDANSQVEYVNPDESPDSFLENSVMEKVLQRRSLRLRNMQRAWQESPEGQKMMEFRKSLPAFKEKGKASSSNCTFHSFTTPKFCSSQTFPTSKCKELHNGAGYTLVLVAVNGMRKADQQLHALGKVIVISGETGCGKTTQLPQYIVESEIETGRGAFCSIICTQPEEYLLWQLQRECLQKEESHLGKRYFLVGMNEDFLLIVLKDLLPRRRDLRLILMSATLNAELFSNYFGGAPKIHIPNMLAGVSCIWIVISFALSVLRIRSRPHFLEDVLELTGYKLSSFNQIDDYGQEKCGKMQKQLAPRKRKNQITALVEVMFE
ncbi:hypothetical protein V6N11_046086 [Hibiscus sabdariffa]|uniref:RNA helicase n=1 Tax=Hibiscus sabdariffa TaxID=183260 RepID=A0ABR1ZSH5_9ROSI